MTSRGGRSLITLLACAAIAGLVALAPGQNPPAPAQQPATPVPVPANPLPPAPAPAPLTQPAATQPTTAPVAATRPVATQPVAAAFVADVKQFGAKGDAVTDDTASIQAALDFASQAGGGVVFVPAGKYLVNTHLTIPSAVTLEGIWRAPAAKAPAEHGSVLLAIEGAGAEKGTAFITISANGALKGISVLYPNQKPDKIDAYPYCIAGAGENVAIVDCLLVNPFQAIDLGSSPSARHLVRNVSGQPLRRGIYVDQCYDPGRIENVHFGATWNWDEKSGIQAWMAQNAEAFVFARTDSQAVLDTFCYGYKVGYRFIASADGGAPSGSLLGCGADATTVAILVEATGGGGLLVGNGQFVSFTGEKPTQVVTYESFSGNLQFQNCAFWGAAQQVARLAGPGTVSFGNCNFGDWANGLAAIDCSGGNLIVTGSSFAKAQPQVALQNKAQSAVIVGNRFAGAANIANPANAVLQAGLNTEPKPAAPAPPPPPAK